MQNFGGFILRFPVRQPRRRNTESFVLLSPLRQTHKTEIRPACRDCFLTIRRPNDFSIRAGIKTAHTPSFVRKEPQRTDLRLRPAKAARKKICPTTKPGRTLPGRPRTKTSAGAIYRPGTSNKLYKTKSDSTLPILKPLAAVSFDTTYDQSDNHG